MTPLAAYLAKQLTARPKHREGIWRDPAVIPDLRKALEDIHCFEVTDCWALLTDMMKRWREGNYEPLFEKFGFLPAPKTWMEWRITGGSGLRRAVCLMTNPDLMDVEGVMRETVGVSLFEHQNAAGVGWLVPTTGEFQLDGESIKLWPTDMGREPGRSAAALMGIIETMLVLINSPKIIGRRQHMPNAALERNLTRGFGVGKFPLHAWTEIKLEVAKPPEIDDGEPHEAHLTGRRALHFCRKHIRIRNGQLEYVSAHWRGDPALGIKRSRYTVRPSA
jgi:hypothetical protein